MDGSETLDGERPLDRSPEEGKRFARRMYLPRVIGSALGVEEQRVNVILDFAEPLDRVQTIGDGFRVDAHIVIYRAEAAVKAPVGALFRDGNGWAVFVAEGDRAVKRRVSTPRRNALEALIEQGLKPGEQVIVYPADSLREGSRLSYKR